MFLNEFLNFKLDVALDEKYNVMVIKEILNNKDKYPIIYEIIENEVSYDDNDEYNGEDLDSSFFDCDDPDCAGYDDIMELYNAFLNVFFKDIRKKDFKVSMATYGIDYLRLPNVHCIINPYLNYSGIRYITMNNNKTTIGEEIFVPNIWDNEFCGHRSIDIKSKIFYDYNVDVLKKIKDSLCNIIDKGDISISSFNNEKLKENKVDLGNDISGYGFDSFELLIDNNMVRFYSNDRTKNNYDFIRKIVLESLSEEEKDLHIVKNIIK